MLLLLLLLLFRRSFACLGRVHVNVVVWPRAARHTKQLYNKQLYACSTAHQTIAQQTIVQASKKRTAGAVFRSVGRQADAAASWTSGAISIWNPSEMESPPHHHHHPHHHHPLPPPPSTPTPPVVNHRNMWPRSRIVSTCVRGPQPCVQAARGNQLASHFGGVGRGKEGKGGGSRTLAVLRHESELIWRRRVKERDRQTDRQTATDRQRERERERGACLAIYCWHTNECCCL